MGMKLIHPAHILTQNRYIRLGYKNYIDDKTKTK